MIQNWWNRMRLGWMMRKSEQKREIERVVDKLRQTLKRDTLKPVILSILDRDLITRIQETTTSLNLNNISRTQAYLDFYRENPEIHWSLLAHCVSRNGGWGMTDAYGEWFMHMASPINTEWFFSFLERANWLIFHDAYPQLLLYQEGKKQNQNLSSLIPALGVSKFMEPMWNHFWETQNALFLTRALIINEQNYVESRVIQNSAYKANVISSANFQMQSLMNLNQVLIPYKEGPDVRFTGTTMRHFSSVKNRICIGLCLYQSLYQDEKLHQSIVDFMCHHPHSGSRSDYWPDIFTPAKTEALSHPYCPRFVETNPFHSKIYSPHLEVVCPQIKHKNAEPGDWFKDFSHIVYLFDNVAFQPRDISDTYIHSIQTIEGLLQMKEKAEAILPGK